MILEKIKTSIPYQLKQIDTTLEIINKENIITIQFEGTGYNHNYPFYGFEISGAIFDLNDKIRKTLKEYFEESKRQLQSLLTNESEQKNE